MSDAYAALAEDGLRCTASRLAEPRVVQFEDDDPISFPPGASGLAIGVTPVGHVALVRGSDDQVYEVLRSGQVERLDTAFGNNCVGFFQAHAYWINAKETYKVDGTPYSVPVDPPTDPRGFVSPDGWSQILDGQPAWSVWQTRDIGGVLCTRCVRIAHWEVGMDGESVENRYLAFDHRTGTIWIVPNSETQIGPGLAVHGDGSCTVAVSLPAGFVHSSTFLPHQPPSATIPVFEETDEAIGIGVFQEPSAPGLAILLDGGSDQIDPRYPVTPETRAVFCGPSQSVEYSRALAASVKVPALYYLDAYGLTPEQVPEDFRPALYCYPYGDAPITDTLALAEADMAEMFEAGISFDLVVAGYLQFRGPGDYALTEAQVLDTLGALWPLAIKYEAGACWIFHYGRFYNEQLVDGVSYWPSVSEAVRRLRAASWYWRQFPTLDETVPIPPEPPIEPPIDPEPPEPPIEPEEPVAKPTLVLRRDAETPSYLSFQDSRQAVDARLTDPVDARTWLEVTIYDQPGVKAPGQFAYGNKVVLRSFEDQVCIYPEQPQPAREAAPPDVDRPERPQPKKKQLFNPPRPDPQLPDQPSAPLGVLANLNLAGMWDLRAGEFGNTAVLGIPATPLAVYVTEDQRLELRDTSDTANLKSRFDWKVLSVETKDGPTKGQTKEMTIPF